MNYQGSGMVNQRLDCRPLDPSKVPDDDPYWQEEIGQIGSNYRREQLKRGVCDSQQFLYFLYAAPLTN